MSRILNIILSGAVLLTVLGAHVQAQDKPPPFATTKVEGTDNVYVFRYGNSQAMFVVTPAGVIATDPIGYGRPQAVTTYVEEIKKVTDQPIRYVIYSHHHFDHIAGGKPFKDAGAKFVAHKRAKERLAALKDPHTVIPDETVDKNRTIKLGGTALELTYLGLNQFRQHAAHAVAEGEGHLRGGLHLRGNAPGARHDRLLSARVGGFSEKGAGNGLGEADSRPSRRGRAARHQTGRAGHPDVPLGCVGRSKGSGARGEVLGYRRERDEAAEILELAQLRASNAVRPETLLRAMGTWHLSLDHPYGGSVSAVPGTET